MVYHFSISPEFAKKIRVVFVPESGNLKDGGANFFPYFKPNGEEFTDEEHELQNQRWSKRYKPQVPYVRLKDTIVLEDMISSFDQKTVERTGQFRGVELIRDLIPD